MKASLEFNLQSEKTARLLDITAWAAGDTDDTNEAQETLGIYNRTMESEDENDSTNKIQSSAFTFTSLLSWVRELGIIRVSERMIFRDGKAKCFGVLTASFPQEKKKALREERETGPPAQPTFSTTPSEGIRGV